MKILSLFFFCLCFSISFSSCSSVPISRVYVNREKASKQFEESLDSYNKEKDEDRKNNIKLMVYYHLGSLNSLDGILVKHGPRK
jgi:hypothetical protein